MEKVPYAFICHASEDKDTARRMATDLRKAGIETFLDEWEIRAGDSLRQKIDHGLGQCTHFIALLSRISITKPWVNAELDAGFVKKVNSQAVLIPVRLGLETRQLPPLLAGLMSPSMDDYDSGIKTLVEDIHRVSKQPPLAAKPEIFSSAWASRAGLSIGAARVSEIFVKRSKNGRGGDPQIGVDELRKLTEYSDGELMEAIDELEEIYLLAPARVIGAAPFGYVIVRPTDSLFVHLDSVVMGWSPSDDAKTVAVKLINDFPTGARVAELARRLEWPARRINPALSVLIRQNLVTASQNLDPNFVAPYILATPRTKRLAKESIL